MYKNGVKIIEKKAITGNKKGSQSIKP